MSDIQPPRAAWHIPRFTSAYDGQSRFRRGLIFALVLRVWGVWVRESRVRVPPAPE